jgi:hypothetical protein
VAGYLLLVRRRAILDAPGSCSCLAMEVGRKIGIGMEGLGDVERLFGNILE